MARDGCERPASSLDRFTTPPHPHPTPEEGPPVAIEWEVGCAPEVDCCCVLEVVVTGNLMNVN